ncbi:MAG: HAD hydrolase-like protein [Ectothiorhodospiraceae bacterium]|nr:HAD hydrolase-like protein [Chromatiales bacterium]MCP5157567.1 HAD hydrolase-like protein [Ectothiorhodospiraceae bacterium]
MLLLDGYGVLVDGSGALPGAAAFLRRLGAVGREHLLLSNDASRLPETTAARYRALGVPIPLDRILTSGMLLVDHFASADLVARPCVALGPEDSRRLVERAGGQLVTPGDDAAEVVVLCDDDGYPFLPTLEAVVSALVRRIDRGDAVHLVLPNPDLTYPKAPGQIGIAAGAAALVVEAALRLRFGDAAPRFTALGKPHPPIFAAARRQLGLGAEARTVMVGDQLATDIAGANAAGIDSVLIGSGLSRLDALPLDGPRPTWTLAGLD